MTPGEKVVRQGKPDEVFTVDATGRFAWRSYGPEKFNPIDGKWYYPVEAVDLVNGGSFVLEPCGPRP